MDSKDRKLGQKFLSFGVRVCLRKCSGDLSRHIIATKIWQLHPHSRRRAVAIRLFIIFMVNSPNTLALDVEW